MSESVALRAPAKVNLHLRVLGKRPDGYHELDTLFQAIDLADEVTVALGGQGIDLEVVGADVGPHVENLAYRAAAAALHAVGVDTGVSIRLEKRIPAGAGLGGGSSDAAAVLRCLATLIDGLDDAALLHRVATGLGSDVPFFLCGSPLARGTGRGEVLEPLPPLPAADLVVVSPPVHVDTGEAYAALEKAPSSASDAAVVEREEADDPRGPDVPRSWADCVAKAHNDFETVVSSRHPEVAQALEGLAAVGATIALLSGSGSSAFGLFEGPKAAGRAVRELSDTLGWPCWAAKTLETMPDPRVE